MFQNLHNTRVITKGSINKIMNNHENRWMSQESEHKFQTVLDFETVPRVQLIFCERLLVNFDHDMYDFWIYGF